MENMLTIRIPNQICQILNRTSKEMEHDIRMYAAMMFFRLGKLSSGTAASLAGIPRVMFLDLCADYDIPISQISGEDLRQEIRDE